MRYSLNPRPDDVKGHEVLPAPRQPSYCCAMGNSPEATPAPVQSVDRALAILEILARRRDAGVTDIGKELGVHKSTAFRLLAVLDPEVVLRSDGGITVPFASAVVRGSDLVAQRAMMFANPAAILHHTNVNGLPGVVITVDDTIISIMAFTVVAGRIVSIDATADPDLLATVDWHRP